jgi:hypothetical protein
MSIGSERPPQRSSIARTLRGLTIAVVGLVVIVGFLLGPDLFMSIPWRVRWWMGELAFLAVVLGFLTFKIFRSQPQPWALLDPAHDPARTAQRVVAWGLQAITLSFAYPLFSRPEGWGALGDWDLHLQWYEAMRQSVLRFGQFPWWNPWNSGGWLLAAEPQFGLVALDTPLVLLFGTTVGLRLALIVDLMLAVEGTRRLARLWFADPAAVATAAVVYGWNGAIIIAATGNRALPMAYPFLPWLLYFAFQVDRGRRQAIWLGVTAAASVLAVIQYPTFYAAAITAIVLGIGFLARRGAAERLRYAVHLGIAAGICLVLCGWRLAMSGLVFRDFPRILVPTADYSLRNWFDSLVHRSIPPPDIYTHTFTLSPDWFPELACYVGPVVVALAVISVAWGWRWWHTLALVCFTLAWGGVQVYQPSYWMKEWPVFSSMHVVSRWRIPGVLGLALAAASAIEGLGARTGRFRLIGAGLAVWIVVDLALYAHQCLPAAWSVPPADVHYPDGPTVGTIVNLHHWEFFGNTQGFQCLERGYGVIGGYCPQLGYDRAGRPTARRWLGQPDYRGESWNDRSTLEPVMWSPNRIEFRVGPHEQVEINQNPGSWWMANGAPAFPEFRCAELQKPFLVGADAQGRLVLEIRPRGIGLALWLTLAGVGLLVLCTWVTTRLDRRPHV